MKKNAAVASVILVGGLSAAAVWYYGASVAKCGSSHDLAALEVAVGAKIEVDAARQQARADKSPAAQEALRAAEQKYSDAKHNAETQSQTVAATQSSGECKG